MKLTYMAKEIIKQCSDYIRREDWQNFYGAIYQNDDWKTFCGDVTDALLAAEINPLEGLDYVPDYFLYDSKNITKFDIPHGIDEIATAAFAYCSNLTDISMPNTVTQIGNHAFESTGLTSIKLSDELVTIGDYAFSRTKLTTIEFPATLRSFGTAILLNCENLRKVRFNGDVEDIGGFTFPMHQSVIVEVPKTATNLLETFSKRSTCRDIQIVPY